MNQDAVVLGTTWMPLQTICTICCNPPQIQLIFSGRLHWQCLDPFTQQDVGLDSALPHPNHRAFFVADVLLEHLWNPPAEAAQHYGFHHLNHTYLTWNLSAHPHGHQGIQEHLLSWQIPTARKNLYCWLSAFHSLVRGFGAVNDTGLQSGIQVRPCLVAIAVIPAHCLGSWCPGAERGRQSVFSPRNHNVHLEPRPSENQRSQMASLEGACLPTVRESNPNKL